MAEQSQQQGPLPYYPAQMVPSTYVYPGSPQPIKYNSKVAKVLGTIQIINGAVCIVLQIINLATYSYVNLIGYGIWGGILFIVAGALQILSGRNSQNTCLINSTMVMSIIAACVTPIILSFSIMCALSATTRYYRYSYHYEGNDLAVALNSIMAIVSIIEAIVAIVSSAFCCKAVCCCNPNQTTNLPPVYVLGHVGSNQTMFIPTQPSYQVANPTLSHIPINPNLPHFAYPTAPIFGESSVADPPPSYDPVNSEIKSPLNGF